MRDRLWALGVALIAVGLLILAVENARRFPESFDWRAVDTFVRNLDPITGGLILFVSGVVLVMVTLIRQKK